MIRDVHIDNVDIQIVRAQMRRLVSTHNRAIIILGDSSALMGIDPSILQQKLGKPIESYATLGVVGPEGYAYMLDLLSAEKSSIEYVLLVLHPVQFHREQYMEVWIPLLKDWNKTASLDPNRAPLDFVRGIANRYLVYSPLPGHYSLYYGSPEKFVGMINDNKGSAIDPGAGIKVNSLRAYSRLPNQGYLPIAMDKYRITDSYRKALAHLKRSVTTFGREKIVLMPGPLPLGPNVGAQRTILADLKEIAEILELPHKNIVVPSITFSLDAKYFSSITHLNRFGKLLYSTKMVDEIAFMGVNK